MEKVTLREGDDFIRLGQAMKKAGCVGSGLDAKIMIQDGQVQVNGDTETRRGRKLVEGDIFTFEDESYQVVRE
ncbi:MAG: RNA-binding S4 domain-containing protein [Lachnospiraceae bacterium]|nr:RNA-binding S4 domain-containing protein [Lachnospiraceae bacterium]MDD6449868.1 RNA-binding S4 domain-containing protein [Lachnospiraceae bacterium]MDD6451356.1 RNA-binding S4 domain-containing protein [Lachnospiraceae bacterium]MDD6578288.1 RNA-binding S4 domain-containing protein [Lachnospiraceae bacterium]